MSNKTKKDQELTDKELDGAAGGMASPGSVRPGGTGPRPAVMPRVPDLSTGKVDTKVPGFPDKTGPLK